MPREGYLQHRFGAGIGVFARQLESVTNNEDLCEICHENGKKTDHSFSKIFEQEAQRAR